MVTHHFTMLQKVDIWMYVNISLMLVQKNHFQKGKTVHFLLQLWMAILKSVNLWLIEQRIKTDKILKERHFFTFVPAVNHDVSWSVVWIFELFKIHGWFPCQKYPFKFSPTQWHIPSNIAYFTKILLLPGSLLNMMSEKLSAHHCPGLRFGWFQTLKVPTYIPLFKFPWLSKQTSAIA